MTQSITATLPDLGTFEGFNFRDQCAIERPLTAQDVIQWDHDADGEAEFWPSGEDPLVRGIFDRNVTAADLTALAELLAGLHGDCTNNLLRIQFAIRAKGLAFANLTVRELEDQQPMFFHADTLIDARKDAAFELFETFWPDLFKAWDEAATEFLRFEWDDLLDSSMWTTLEVKVGDKAILMVTPN